MKKTLLEQYSASLEKLGAIRQTTRSSKYIVYLYTFLGPSGSTHPRYVFLGSAGAVRINVTNSASGSLSTSDKFKAKILSGEA